MADDVEFDESAWPRLIITWPPINMSDALFHRAVDRISGYTKRGEPYVIIHDARKATRPTPTQRAFAAERQKEDAPAAKKWLRGVAIVVSSSFVAGVVTAINWVAPPPYPEKIFSSMREAEEWVDGQLGKGAGGR
jgi:hypothetical protein